MVCDLSLSCPTKSFFDAFWYEYYTSGKKVPMTSAQRETLKEDQPSLEDKGTTKIPETHSHGLAKKPTQTSPSQADFLSCGKTSITPKDKEIWDRLKVSGETRYVDIEEVNVTFLML